MLGRVDRRRRSSRAAGRGRRARAAAGRVTLRAPRRCSAARPAAGGATRCRRTRSTTGVAERRHVDGRPKPFLDGWRVGAVWGTVWHGAFENDGVPPGLAGRGRRGGRLAWTPDAGRPGVRGPAGGHDRHPGRRGRGAPRPGPAARRHPVREAGAVTVRVLVIGIGSGDPDHLTGEAVAALNAGRRLPRRGQARRRSATWSSCAPSSARRCITHDRYRFVEVPDPERGPGPGADATAYRRGRRLARRPGRRLRRGDHRARSAPTGTVGFLVWGDPSLYDSHAADRRVGGRASRASTSRSTVIPGISSVQPARRRGTGSRSTGSASPSTSPPAAGWSPSTTPALGDVVVMLDGDLACAGLVETHPDLRDLLGRPARAARRGAGRRPAGRGADEIRARRDGRPRRPRLGDGHLPAATRRS